MIKKLVYGDYGEMDTVEFGDGDISMSRSTAKLDDGSNYQVIAFTESEKIPVLQESPELIGKPVTSLPKPIFIMSFKNPESILSLIMVLTTAMEDIYKSKIKE